MAFLLAENNDSVEFSEDEDFRLRIGSRGYNTNRLFAIA